MNQHLVGRHISSCYTKESPVIFLQPRYNDVPEIHTNQKIYVNLNFSNAIELRTRQVFNMSSSIYYVINLKNMPTQLSNVSRNFQTNIIQSNYVEFFIKQDPQTNKFAQSKVAHPLIPMLSQKHTVQSCTYNFCSKNGYIFKHSPIKYKLLSAIFILFAQIEN